MNATPTWSTRDEAWAVLTHRPHVRRTITIALTVGSIFFALNQLGIVLAGKATVIVWLKAALTYFTPLVVSNIGILSATRRPAERRTRARSAAAISAACMTVLVVLVSAAPAMAEPGTRSPVYRFVDGSQVAGAWSSLATSNAGGKVTLQTTDLATGHTVTIWWVIFNEPQNCIHSPAPGLACGPGDLPPFGGDPSVVSSVVYAAGHVVGGSGNATFSGRLATGDASDALWGPGLTKPTTAEIHFVVHDHGMLTPNQRAEGIHNFGPCDQTCTDLQFSPHPQ